MIDTYYSLYHGTMWENYGVSLAVYDMSRVSYMAQNVSNLASRSVNIMNSRNDE